jgi:gliding motility-associated-like protein
VFVSGAKNYEWTPSNFVSNPNSSNPYLSPSTTTNFSVKGIDNFGCFSENNLLIDVKENFLIYPNIIITPNGDQINDFWEIKNIEFYPKNSIQIFDTNGQTIKVLNNYSNDWDGSINGLILPIGTYYYQINLNEGASITEGFFSIIY